MRELQFSAMVNQFQPGIFTALNDKKEEMIQAGKRVFNLSVGTPDFARISKSVNFKMRSEFTELF